MKQTNTGYGRVVAVILFLGLFCGNYFQYQLSPLAPQLMQELEMTPVQFSSIFSAPMLSAIFLGIIAGILSDKFGVKKICSVGLVIMAVGLWIRPFAGSYLAMYTAMVLSGFGITFLNINMSKIIGGWFAPEKIGPIMGVTMVGCTLGMTFGTATTAFFPSTKSAFIVSAVFETIILVLWILFMKDGNTGENNSTAENRSAKEAFIASAKSKNVWLVGICLMCIMGCNVCLTSFLPTAMESRGISIQTAGMLTAALTVGNMVGSLAGTILIARIGKMKPCLLIFSLIVAVCSAIAWSSQPIGIVITLGATGFCFGAMMPTFMSFPALLPEIGPQYAGTATGIIATLELIGAVVIPTYIITPLAGTDFKSYFFMAGATMIICAAVILMLPELLKRKES